MNFDHDGISFRAEFPNGYAIRKLVDFFKDAYGMGEWIFSKEGIKGYANNNDLSSCFEIKADSIPNYEFSCPPPPGDQFCRFGIDFVIFNNHIKSVTKKKKVALIKLPDSINLLLEYDGDKSTATWIAGRNDKREYLPEPNMLRDHSTCSVTSKDLKEKLVKFSALKIPNVQIICHTNTIIMYGSSENATNGYMKQFGLEPTDQPLVNFVVTAKTLKKIAKMSDITSVDGIIKLWGQESTTMSDDNGESYAISPLLKVQCSIGHYGELKTYIYGCLVGQ